jgi:phosphoribosylformimino-5-aminoimidazole carboxamide ribonucleotide (ProFAR) isomerase
VALYPGQIGVALEVRDRRVVGSQFDIVANVEAFANVPVAAIVVTSVQRRGTMQGADVNVLADVVRASDAPVMAAGGIGRRRDLDDLTDCGISAAIIGTALCNGTLEPGLLAEEYGT